MKNTIIYKIGLAVVSTLLLILFVMLLVLLLNEENLKIENTYKSVKETDDLLRKSVTFSMNSGATDLEPFKESIGDSKTLLELRLTPTNLIEKDSERDLDSVEKEVLSKSEPKYFEEEFNGIPVFRAVELIKANKTCLECHDVKEGETLVIISGRYSMADTYNSIYSQRIIATIMAIVSVAIIFFILMYIIRKRVVTPITRLNESAKKVAAGDTSVHVDVIDETEIGQLTTSFNQMVEKISLQIGYLSNLPSPVMIINKNYEIEYMNKAGLDIVNSTSNEILGKKCYNYLKMEHCNTEKCALKQAMNKGTTVTEENIARPNGKEYSVMYTGSPVYNRENQLVGALEFIADISNIKNMQDYLSRSTQKLLVGMSKFADGDLSACVTPEKHGDDIEKLFVAFNEIVEKFNSTILTIMDAVEATASASNQISSSAEEMAAGAQQQSSQTAEVAAAMEEMSRTIVETASNATISAEASRQANEKANEGAIKLKDSKEGMNRIVNSTETVGKNISSLANKTVQIGAIAQVIDDIADQTNLLALNAAIEAARAGEHGRGFAVVADEVRKLAENTTKATKEIADTIKSIQLEAKDANNSMKEAGEAVNNGLHLNAEVGEVLTAILESINNVTSQINQVAAASEEQSATAEQVSTNIEAINNVANESAVGVQQIASASEDLNLLTEKLQTLISKFKVNNKNMQLYN